MKAFYDRKRKAELEENMTKYTGTLIMTTAEKQALQEFAHIGTLIITDAELAQEWLTKG